MNEFNNIFEKLLNLQKRLMKNYENPVFKNSEKNKLLKKYNELGRLGKSLFRYSTLLQNNLLTNEEEDYISNMVLKGGISNYRYIWHSENSDKTCNECASLDGKVYNFQDEVPEPLHPNCRCWVEVVEEKNRVNKKQDEDEPCDCWEAIQKILDEVSRMHSRLGQIIAHMEYLKTDIENELNKINLSFGKVFDLNPDYVFETIKILHFIIQVSIITTLVVKGINAFAVFNEYKNNMFAKLDGHKDKYWHTKANCDVSKEGYVDAMFAFLLSVAKEIVDYYIKVVVNHLDAKTVAEDCMQDLYVDFQGIKEGITGGNCDQKAEEMEKIYYPKN